MFERTCNAARISLLYVVLRALGNLFPNVSQLYNKLLMTHAVNAFNRTHAGANLFSRQKLLKFDATFESFFHVQF